jgi:hypothetical protein
VFCELSSFVAPPHLGAFTVFFPQATTALEAIEGRHVPNFGFLYINYNDHGYAKVLGHHSFALSPFLPFGGALPLTYVWFPAFCRRLQGCFFICMESLIVTPSLAILL